MIELSVISAIDLSIIWITKKLRYFNEKMDSVANYPFYFQEDDWMPLWIKNVTRVQFQIVF